MPPLGLQDCPMREAATTDAEGSYGRVSEDGNVFGGFQMCAKEGGVGGKQPAGKPKHTLAAGT